MKRIAQWLGLLSTIAVLVYLAWPHPQGDLIEWGGSAAAPHRPAGTQPRITVFSHGSSGRLSLEVSGKDPELNDGTVLLGGIGLRRGTSTLAVAGDRNMELNATVDLDEAVALDVVGTVEFRVLGADDAVILAAVISSFAPSNRITLEWKSDERPM